MNYRRPRLSRLRSNGIVSVAVGCCAILLGQLVACSDDGDDDGGDDDTLDPNHLQDNLGGSGGSGGSGGGSSGSGGASGSGGSSGAAGSGGTGGTALTSALDVELYQGLHTDEECATGEPTREECLATCTAAYSACYEAAQQEEEPEGCSSTYASCQTACPAESVPAPRCIYANVYFLVGCNGESVHDLDPDDVQVVIGNKDVGVEGSVLLTQQNGLQVDLLLDRSYSISEANAADTVRDAARGFLDALPDEARVRVSAFASEPQVPQVLGGLGSSYYYEIGTEAQTLEQIVAAGYSPYSVASSVAFTKLFDAAVGVASSARSGDTTLAALPSVGVIFTDGADTASTQYETASAARARMTSENPGMKVYSIGLGNAVDSASLDTLSQGRTYSATDKSTLVQVFGDVASELGAIYRYRVLVPSIAYRAAGVLTVNYCGETSVRNFTMDSIGEAAEDNENNENNENEAGPNGCRWAFDDECDEPLLCPSGTDSNDCD